MSNDSHQTLCDLFSDESSEACSAVYDASTFWQDDSSPRSSVITEDVVTAIADDLDGSARSHGSDGSHDSDGSGFPQEAEVPKDVVCKTENIAIAGSYCSGYQSLMSMYNSMAC